jgi:hypothetical protein
MQQSWGMQEEDGRESEMFKKMVLETNIYLLVITFAVSILHMIFDFLAFKNDVSTRTQHTAPHALTEQQAKLLGRTRRSHKQ